jgi:hypothetical protein
MRDTLFDGIPILDLLEITASTTAVEALTRCDQSCVSRLYRHVSDHLGLRFRKTNGDYRAHANQPILRSLRQTANCCAGPTAAVICSGWDTPAAPCRWSAWTQTAR